MWLKQILEPLQHVQLMLRTRGSRKYLLPIRVKTKPAYKFRSNPANVQYPTTRLSNFLQQAEQLLSHANCQSRARQGPSQRTCRSDSSIQAACFSPQHWLGQCKEHRSRECDAHLPGVDVEELSLGFDLLVSQIRSPLLDRSLDRFPRHT